MSDRDDLDIDWVSDNIDKPFDLMKLTRNPNITLNF